MFERIHRWGGCVTFSMHRWGSRLQGSQFRSLLPNAANGESYEADCECLQDPKNSNQTENHSWNLKRNFIALEIQIQYGTSKYSLLYIYCHRLLKKKTKTICLKLSKIDTKKTWAPQPQHVAPQPPPPRLASVSSRDDNDLVFTLPQCVQSVSAPFRCRFLFKLLDLPWNWKLADATSLNMSNMHSRYVANESLCL